MLPGYVDRFAQPVRVIFAKHFTNDGYISRLDEECNTATPQARADQKGPRHHAVMARELAHALSAKTTAHERAGVTSYRLTGSPDFAERRLRADLVPPAHVSDAAAEMFFTPRQYQLQLGGNPAVITAVLRRLSATFGTIGIHGTPGAEIASTAFASLKPGPSETITVNFDPLQDEYAPLYAKPYAPAYSQAHPAPSPPAPSGRRAALRRRDTPSGPEITGSQAFATERSLRQRHS